ncbi:hypothetical protein C2W62_28700 [Candidatus Entotheonella serta]|nr:hypothetical protein C2W62_28700 [Candidatus Entotheonella serta]
MAWPSEAPSCGGKRHEKDRNTSSTAIDSAKRVVYFDSHDRPLYAVGYQAAHGGVRTEHALGSQTGCGTFKDLRQSA